mgnify:CR=1 FL=1
MKDLPVAVILAGGASSRFAPLSDKNTLKFLGKTLIEHHLDALQTVGITDAIIITNPANNAAMKQTLANYENVKFAVQQQPRGMGDAMLAAENIILNDFKGKPIYILNADDIFELEHHKKILSEYEKGTSDSIIGAYQVNSYFPGGYLVVDSKNKILSIKEKPGEGNEPSNMVNTVAHLHKNPEELIKEIKKEYENVFIKTDDHYERAMDKLMKKNNFMAVPHDSWRTVKYPWHVLDAASYFLKKITGKVISPTAKISPNATIRDNIIIEDGAKIFEGAIVGPNSYIGKGAIVGNHALVRESIINENTVVGYCTEICRSFVNDNCWFHTNYIGDSVIDSNVSFGSGAITANLRLDESDVHSSIKGEKINTNRNKFGAVVGRNVRVAVNVNILPGMKVGEGSFIGTHVNLDRDLEPNSYCYVKQQHEVKKNTRSPPSREKLLQDMEKYNKGVKKSEV